MYCCSSGSCTACKVVKIAIFILFTLFQIAAVIGLWNIHNTVGVSSGTPNASLALIVAIIGLMAWSKASCTMCPCNRKSNCNSKSSTCPCGAESCSCKK